MSPEEGALGLGVALCIRLVIFIFDTRGYVLSPNRLSGNVEYEYPKALWTSSFVFCNENFSVLLLL